MGFFDKLLQWTTELDLMMWGPAMIALLLGTHLYLTLRTRGVQFSQFFHSLKIVFREWKN